MTEMWTTFSQTTSPKTLWPRFTLITLPRFNPRPSVLESSMCCLLLPSPPAELLLLVRFFCCECMCSYSPTHTFDLLSAANISTRTHNRARAECLLLASPGTEPAVPDLRLVPSIYGIRDFLRIYEFCRQNLRILFL